MSFPVGRSLETDQPQRQYMKTSEPSNSDTIRVKIDIDK